MRILKYWFRKHMAGCLVLLLAFPLAETAAALPQQAAGDPQSQTAPSPQAVPPDSASVNQPAQADAQQQQNGDTQPVGTAAAPLEKTSGVAASRPAGAVIAPAKQRRARAILIRVSIVIGAAVAVGTVVALSRASPSRPN
jgi:hypothetical protein